MMAKGKDKADTAEGATLDDGKLVVVWVQGPPRGRWRAGFSFGPEPREVEVTGEQFEAIVADPELKLVPPPAETSDPQK